MVILTVLVLLLTLALNTTQRTWLLAENRVETAQLARILLQQMERELVQAMGTTNILFRGETNAVYFVAPVNDNPDNLGDLCEVGYRFDAGLGTNFLWQVSRLQTAPSLSNLTDRTWNIYDANWWDGFEPGATTPVASNCVVDLRFSYLATNGVSLPIPYESHQLPYAVRITMGLVDVRAANRLRKVGGPGTTAGGRITNQMLRTSSFLIYLGRMAQ